MNIIICLAVLSAPRGYAVNTLPGEQGQLSEWDQRRLAAWREMIAGYENLAEQAKLEKVNNFLNQIQYAEDSREWGKKDYWATPAEFISRNAGDCEDFAIAKYFTLVAMGVPESRLRITYVHSLTSKQAHMVLYYYPDSKDQPLVLDNLSQQIQPASSRPDLVPVYSFNRQGLWLVNKNGSSRFVDQAKRLGRWQSLLKRMPRLLLARS
ncbi:MAG: transglutaminase-like cysteine peptidase [Thioalkalispiraceae bacterium]